MISSDWQSQIFESQAQNEFFFFCYFLEFGSLLFIEIVYSDSLQQRLASSRGKNHEKKFAGPKFGPKLREIRYFAIFSSLAH